MRTKSLFGVLSGIVSAVVASSTVTVGCGELAGGGAPLDAGGDGSWPPPLPDESTFSCTSPLADVLTNLNPATPVDYVELRAQVFDNVTNDWARDPDAGSVDPDADGGGGDALLPTNTVSTNGAACATASDRNACLGALAALRIEKGQGWNLDQSQGGDQGLARTKHLGFVVYTRGDEVGVAATGAELAAFLGTVDTLEEARLLMTTQSRDLACTTAPFKSGWRKNADGSWEVLVTGSSCGNPYQIRMKISADGVVTRGETRTHDTGAVCGRRPEGLVTNAAPGAAVSLGAWLAEAAHLEAASVLAFRRLERELTALGAPRALVVAARRSRADEIRHAREMALLARRFGATPPQVEVEELAPRSPFAIALENAVEGCVRETYGALVAAYQARTASDPELRTVLDRIARDEARHAALAHDVASWLEPRLDDEERAAIARARADAVADLRAAVLRPPAADVAALAGMPKPREARALLDAMEHAVLSSAA